MHGKWEGVSEGEMKKIKVCDDYKLVGREERKLWNERKKEKLKWKIEEEN